nr:restriction endonuclease subunit S [Nocardioides sp.]
MLPRHWTTRRLRSVVDMLVSNVDKLSKDGEVPVRLCNYVDVYKRDVVTPDQEFMRATATQAEVDAFCLRIGDVVITKDSESFNDIAVPAYIAGAAKDLVCGYHLAILRPRGDISGQFLYWALRAPTVAHQFHVAAGGVTRFGLSHEDIKSAWVPVPPADEQAAIVKYLTHANARIDKAIAAKRRLIALLDEQRNELATERLENPNLGWQVRRLKTLLHGIDQGVSPQADNTVPGQDEWGVLKAGCVNGGKYRPDQVKRLPGDFVVPLSLAIRKGDLLVSRASGSPNLVGSVARVPAPPGKVILSDKTFRLRPRDDVDPDFLALAMNSRRYRSQVRQAISGADGLANNLPITELRTFTFLVPPIDEQRRIVADVSRETATILHTAERTEREVTLLQEFRTRLVADVVTGQVDVRQIAASLPEVDPADLGGGDETEIDELVGNGPA